MKKIDVTHVTITSFHYDLLKLIIMLLVKSSKGAEDFARTLAVCKYFAKFEKDEDVLKTIDFDSVELSDRTESFLGIESLINKSAQAGNISAQYLLSKVILVASSQLWLKMEPGDEFVSLDVYVNRAAKAETNKQDLQSSFLSHFMDNQSSSSSRSGGSLFHTQLVRLFLCRCNIADLVSMRRFLKLYFSIFTVKASLRCIQSFRDSIDEMYSTVLFIVNFDCKNGGLWSEPETQLFPAEVERLARSFLRNPYPRSALKREEHEREREQSVDVDLGLRNEEADNLCEYLFHHLVKKNFDEGGEAPSPNVLCDFRLDVGKSFCAAFAGRFETERVKAIKAFDEALPPK